MKLAQYFRLWLACARYSVVRTMMFRFDTLMWGLVELFWMGVNVASIEVVYRHTESVAGWSKPQMLLLIGTSMVIQRLVMGFFWSNLFEMGRNVRSGHFDFFLAQPGNPLFMVSTRKIDLDGIANIFVALSLVIYAAHEMHLQPSLGTVALYVVMILCGLVINYSMLLMIVSLTFWIIKTEGVEGSYFTFSEFSRLPREAYKRITGAVFVYILPAGIVANVPARTLMDGFTPHLTLWLAGAAALWFFVASRVFFRGLRRYASASS